MDINELIQSYIVDKMRSAMAEQDDKNSNRIKNVILPRQEHSEHGVIFPLGTQRPEIQKSSFPTFNIDVPMPSGTLPPKPSVSLEFVDVSNEEWREYGFDSGVFRIQKPLKLNVVNHGHRVFDAQGITHYIPNSWIRLSCKTVDGKPSFT